MKEGSRQRSSGRHRNDATRPAPHHAVAQKLNVLVATCRAPTDGPHDDDLLPNHRNAFSTFRYLSLIRQTELRLAVIKRLMVAGNTDEPKVGGSFRPAAEPG